jgi:phosphatidylglycerol:prolipoprotein diacylglycerol transferase
LIGLLSFDPIVYLHLGPVRISPHGIATAVGFLAGARLLLARTRLAGIADEVVHSMLTRAALGALVGARVAYAVNHFSEYDNPLEVLQVWQGGLSLFGGITGGILAALPVVRREKIHFWPLMDAAAPGLALGIAIGRVGDLVVGDHLGKETDFALGFKCTGADSASPCDAQLGSGVHMPALYDLVSAAMLLGVLLWLRRRVDRPDGQLILVAAAWYGTGRFLEDFLRIDDVVSIGLSGSQLTAALLVVVALSLLLARRSAPARGLEQPDPPATAKRVGRVRPPSSTI